MNYTQHPKTGLKWGLKERIKHRDPRNLKRSNHFGAANLDSIPSDFDLAPDFEVLNQLDSTFCTAFSNAVASGIQEDKILSPEFGIQKTKLIQGGDPHSWGANPYAGFKSQVKYGGLERKDNPFPLEEKGGYFVEDPANWTAQIPNLDPKAFEHRKKSYMEADDFDNHFDSALSTMWSSHQASKAYNETSKKRAILWGVMWQPSWTYAEGGVIPNDTSGFDKTLPHQVCLKGSKMINGKRYLIVQNSWGQLGDKGLYYVPREVMNSKYTIYLESLEDIDPNVAKESWSIVAVLIDILNNLYRSFANLLRK